MVLHNSMVRFFFCKQKTAYEMRISDWSSDVCSSDLLGPRKPVSQVVVLDGAGLRQVEDDAAQLRVDPLELGRKLSEATADQIGRASCRERVCQTFKSRLSQYS